jgi:hypothetical protein
MTQGERRKLKFRISNFGLKIHETVPPVSLFPLVQQRQNGHTHRADARMSEKSSNPGFTFSSSSSRT